MYAIDSPSQRTREGGAAGTALRPDAETDPRLRSDRTRPPETVDRPVVDTGKGVARIVREYPVGSLARRSTASGPSVRGSLRPHCEQNARWSAFSCAQWRQERIAVVSLLYPWYRSRGCAHERRCQDQ